MALKGNKNALGNHGSSWTDKKLSAEVRNLALKEMLLVLRGKNCNFKKAVILKLAGTVLPRLNEHGGEDGGPIKLQWIK